MTLLRLSPRALRIRSTARNKPWGMLTVNFVARAAVCDLHAICQVPFCAHPSTAVNPGVPLIRATLPRCDTFRTFSTSDERVPA